MARVKYYTTPTGVDMYWEEFQPTGTGPWPAALVLHVGGYKSGGNGPLNVSQDLQTAGILAFAAEYRLAPPGNPMRTDHGHEAPGQDTVGDDGHYPEQTDDVAVAIQTARADPRCNGLVYCVGGSAGGSHSMFMAATGTNGDDRPDLVVACSCGVSNLGDPHLLALAEVPGETSPHGACTNYVGITDTWPTYSGGDLATLTAASPVTYMVGIQPPMWVMMSSIDSLGIPTSCGIVGQSDRGPLEMDVENGLIPKLLSPGVGMTESTAEVPEIGKFKKTVVPVLSHSHAFNYWNLPLNGTTAPTVGESVIAWLLGTPIIPPPPPPPETEPIGYHLTMTGGNYTVIDPIPKEYIQVEVTDLEPDTEYTARLVAYNAFGESPPAFYSFRSDPAVGGGGGQTAVPTGIVHFLGEGCTNPFEFWSCFDTLETLDLSFVDGIRVRGGLSTFEPSEGTFFWDNLDAVIATAASKGKWLTISISPGRGGTPDWMYVGAPACSLYDSGTGVAGCMKFPVDPGDHGGPFQPVPWNTLYLSRLQTFINAFGARYDANPTIKAVFATGFMQNVEFYLSNSSTDDAHYEAQAIADGFVGRSAAYQFAAETIIDYWHTAFPSTPVFVTYTRVWSIGSGIHDEDDVLAYQLATYPQLGGSSVSTAKAVLPENRQPPAALVPYPFGSQAARSSTDSRFYQPENPSPPADPQPVDDLCQEAIVEGRQYLEIDGPDLITHGDPTLLEAARQALKANAALVTGIGPKTQPRGIYAFISAPNGIWGDQSGAAYWGMSYIAGARASTRWNVMQASEPNINLQQITDILAVAAANGKKVGLSFSAGIGTPQWVYDAGALPFVLHSAGGGTMPMPWDTVYQAKFRNLIQAVGNAFDGHPNLDYVVMGGMGQQIDTTLVQFVDQAAANAAAQALGYANCAEGWLAGAQVITGFFASSFPTTPLIASIARVATKSLDNDENVVSYVGTTATQYGDRIGYMNTQLSSTSDATIVFNTLVRDNSPLHPAGLQFVNSAATTQEFEDALTAGIALLMKWTEPLPLNYNSSDPDQITAMENAVIAMALLP